MGHKGTLTFLCLLCCLFVSTVFAQPFSSVAFYYGSNPPIDELKAFDSVVLNPNYHADISTLEQANTTAIAYVSVGKISSQQLINTIIAPLWQKGYRGFYLDNLSVFKQIEGRVKLIQLIKQRYPKARLIINRGFDLLPEVHHLISAVSIGPLFEGWNQATAQYQAVSKQDRAVLLSQIDKIKSYHLPIISIEYMSPSDRDKARAIAQKVKALGVIPWVSDYTLSSMGVGSIEVIPRKILVLYDSRVTPDLMEENEAQRFAAMPLNYLGYKLIFQDIGRPLPAMILRGRYAGILSWTTSYYFARFPQIPTWLIKQVKDGVPIVFLGGFGGELTKTLQQVLQLKLNQSPKKSSAAKIIYQSPMMGYETEIFANPYGFIPLVARGGKVLLALKDNHGRILDIAATMPWGGYVLDPYVYTELAHGQVRWKINPLEFFKKAFRFQAMPIPDTTTENGRRLMLVHVDGDAFVSRTEWDNKLIAGEAMLQKIFNRYKIPTTVSIVEGEIAPYGIYSKESSVAMTTAKEIFKLPWVEIASHSFSHPYVWQFMTFKPKKKPDLYGWHLLVPNYKFNLNSEIKGSIDFINQKLAPPGKTCKVFLWTGDCNPNEKAVALTYDNHVLNMNGGETTITNANRSLTNIAPLGLYRGSYFQVFAPNQNENIYTNLWEGPYYGYERVIETFKLTNKPLRFKPIDIYYHFYSVTKKASLQALEAVYDWSLKQSVMNVFASDYIKGVLDFNRAVIAKKNNGWFIKTGGDLRELRASKSMGYPDLAKSQNIVGFSAYGNDFYIHLGPAKQSFLMFSKNEPELPYIKFANGKITQFHRTKKGFEFAISSYLPTKFSLENMKGCKVYYDDSRVKRYQKENKGLWSFNFESKKNSLFVVKC